jgi:hypothetical protein
MEGFKILKMWESLRKDECRKGKNCISDPEKPSIRVVIFKKNKLPIKLKNCLLVFSN